MTDRRAYDKVQVGPFFATVLPDFDFETYSEAGYVWAPDEGSYGKWMSPKGKGGRSGLPIVGAPVYAEHPSTEILSLAYSLKDGNGRRIWIPGMAPPQELFNYISEGGLIEAHNSMFEFLIWNYVGHRKLGWPQLDYRQLRCSASKARAFSYPGGLGSVSKIVNVALKDSAKGQRVIKRYCCPRTPTKNNPATRIHPHEEPAGVELYQYNDQDIVAESAVSEKCPDLSPRELELWLLDQKINIRGVHIDMESVRALTKIVDDSAEHYAAEIQRASGGAISAPSEAAKITGWLHGRGVHVDDVQEETLAEALEGDIPDDAREVIEIRKATASAGVKKLQAMNLRTSSDDRMRDIFVYYRAHTGRFSSEGIQLQNMVSSGPKLARSPCCGFYFPVSEHLFCPVCKIMDPLEEPVEWNATVMDATINLLRTCDFNLAQHYLGSSLLPAIAASMRGMVTAPPGKELMCSDYSAIEAVVLAVIANEPWRVEVFRTHGKIYEKTASDITGIPFDDIVNYPITHGGNHPSRKPFGKIPELASGYGGWVGAWLSFGAGKFMSDDEIKDAILKWRAASPNIVELWGGQYRETYPGSWDFRHEYHGLEGMAILAVLNPGNWYTYGYISYICTDDKLFCKLPSGRFITYHQPRLAETEDRRARLPSYQLTYMFNNTNAKKGKIGWIRAQGYGGSLTENVVQAIARDLLREGMLNLDAAGYRIVGHVHDEIIAEVDPGQGSIEEFEALMMKMPAWAHDWPIKAAGGWRGHRYRKE